MPIRTLTAILLTFCGTLSPLSTLKAEAPSLAKPSSPAQLRSVSGLMDAVNDYDLWVAEPETANAWYIRWTYDDGVVRYSAAYYDFEHAQDHLIWCLLHGVDPRNSLWNPDLDWPDSELVYLPKTPDWVFFRTCDSYSEAALDAAWFNSFGLLTKITSRSVLQASGSGLRLP